MRRKRRKAAVNRKRFIFSSAIIIGSIFVLTITVKSAVNKITKLNNVSTKSIIAYAVPKFDPKFDQVFIDGQKNIGEIEKKTCNDQKKQPIKKQVSNDNRKIENNKQKNNQKIDNQKRQKEPIKEKVYNVEQKDNVLENNYKKIFQQDLFIGDSITDSLSFYEILEEKNVVAKLGLTLAKAEDSINNIIKLKPQNIYILFGMNDILTGIDSQKFAKNYAKFVNNIKQKLPNTNIYVQSILPVSDNVKSKKPLLTNSRINKFNDALINMCKDKDVDYINLRFLVENNHNLYEPDGIHLKYNFYKLWLDYLTTDTKGEMCKND